MASHSSSMRVTLSSDISHGYWVGFRMRGLKQHQLMFESAQIVHKGTKSCTWIAAVIKPTLQSKARCAVNWCQSISNLTYCMIFFSQNRSNCKEKTTIFATLGKSAKQFLICTQLQSSVELYYPSTNTHLHCYMS